MFKRFIVINVPPEPVFGEVENYKNICSLLGNSYTAMRYPAHITLRTGFLIHSHG